ncbi:hypothetical protein PSACC_00424 [Paramicrosporidium saccamoebae]|uniref:Uncharacterized protein n=1 Tax=Paramicrosporidium saccamoebae TaxID=1246581 RepID=A0A2H9TPW0_9FUNG|nr:hypothetical protein PSACC_00424 [Paramicrosporidium saccamoebae]
MECSHQDNHRANGLQYIYNKISKSDWMVSATERGESKLCSDLSKRRHFKVDNGELRLKQMSNLDSEDSDCLRLGKGYFGHTRIEKSQSGSSQEPPPWNLFFQSRRLNYTTSEKFFILLIFTSPVMGAYFIQVSKLYFGEGNIILKHFSIPLFLGAALLRPVIYFLREGGRASSSDIEMRRVRRQVGILLDRVDQLDVQPEQRGGVVDVGSGQRKQLAALLKRVEELESQIVFLYDQLAEFKTERAPQNWVFGVVGALWTAFHNCLCFPFRIPRYFVQMCASLLKR